jgi:hypothetical protein
VRGDLEGLRRARGDLGDDNLLYEGVGGGQDSGSVLEEPSAQSGAEVGHAGVIVGEWARREAVRAEDASKAVFELEPIAFASRIPR